MFITYFVRLSQLPLEQVEPRIRPDLDVEVIEFWPRERYEFRRFAADLDLEQMLYSMRHTLFL